MLTIGRGRPRVESMSDNCTHRKWRSFREALRSAFSSHDIERLELKLSALKNDLQLHFIYDIKCDGPCPKNRQC